MELTRRKDLNPDPASASRIKSVGFDGKPDIQTEPRQRRGEYAGYVLEGGTEGNVRSPDQCHRAPATREKKRGKKGLEQERGGARRPDIEYVIPRADNSRGKGKRHRSRGNSVRFRARDALHRTDGGKVLRHEARLPPVPPDVDDTEGFPEDAGKGKSRPEDLSPPFPMTSVDLDHGAYQSALVNGSPLAPRSDLTRSVW